MVLVSSLRWVQQTRWKPPLLVCRNSPHQNSYDCRGILFNGNSEISRSNPCPSHSAFNDCDDCSGYNASMLAFGDIREGSVPFFPQHAPYRPDVTVFRPVRLKPCGCPVTTRGVPWTARMVPRRLRSRGWHRKSTSRFWARKAGDNLLVSAGSSRVPSSRIANRIGLDTAESSAASLS
jgi:hypothetical protein